MTELTAFLREQTLSGANKCMRAALPEEWSTAWEPYSIPVRKALAQKLVFDNMPLYIGEGELIVGTRSLYKKRSDNVDGKNVSGYSLNARIPYINQDDIALFGCDQSYMNKTHYTPDYSILLKKGVSGILQDVEDRSRDESLKQINRDFLESVRISYTGLQNLIMRYSEYAAKLAENAANAADRQRLLEISRICKKISSDTPDTFREAVQLLWFGHLGTILESFEFINYGRLDVVLSDYLKDTPHAEAQQILECLLLKMYDQVDLDDDYLGDYAAQLVVTLGGVLPNGENAANDVTMLFLEAIDNVRLPEPEFNLRINSVNPPAFLDRAVELSISGCNQISYYNDDLFVASMHKSGIPLENAREYGFDLCQDIAIPGKADFYVLTSLNQTQELMNLLLEQKEFASFEDLVLAYKARLSGLLASEVERFNRAQEHLFLYRDEKYEEYFAGIKEKGLPADFCGRSPMAPLPYLSALYHGSIENALDLAYEPYPLKEKGGMLGTSVEMINSLAAIKYVVYDTQQYTLKQVVEACEHNYQGKGEEILRNILWNAPKWGNDDDRADQIAKDILEFGLREMLKYKTFSGGQILGGIHQPHPVPTGRDIMATPEGRFAGKPAAVTLTPESGTMANGPTAALKSASKLDSSLIQWNFCIMVNYLASVFKGNAGKQIFKKLLHGYFSQGGLQHQPNILDVAELKEAQLHPERYKDLIVRLWGVSAHFVDLPKELQDEMIARFAA